MTFSAMTDMVLRDECTFKRKYYVVHTQKCCSKAGMVTGAREPSVLTRVLVPIVC